MAGKTEEKRAHAVLSASSSHKWLHCTPSARLEAELEDIAGVAAQEGTLAHSICELKLAKLFTERGMPTRTYNSRMKKLQSDKLYAPEMERFTDAYVDYIKNIAYEMPSAPTVMIEKKIDYSTWAPEGFGTGDCVMLQGDTLHVVDFKYGKGVAIEAEGNPQLSLYALGVFGEFGFIYPIENIVLHIVQPRLNSFSQWSTTKKELLVWGEWVKEKAALAYKGEGEFRQGAYCDECFCKIAGTCRCRANENMEVMKDAVNPIDGMPIEPATLSNDEVGAILKKAQFLKKWVEKLEKYAQRELLEGRQIPGWKLVAGRSNRELSDVDTCFADLIKAGIDEAVLYDRKPIPITKLESLLDKDTWNSIVQSYIIKPPGKPTMVSESDKREVYKPGISVAEAFGGANEFKED